MDRKKINTILPCCVFILLSCAAQDNLITYPVPDKSLFEPEESIDVNDITETMDNAHNTYLPDWLSAFLNGGIEEAEKIDFYNDKYLFIADNRGLNFAVLNKWADNFTTEQDFPMLVAARIERRMNISNSVYPDEEYGIFYETLVKSAYSGVYPGAVREDTYWVKTKAIQENGNGERESAALPEVYNFFVLISVERAAMQASVYNLIQQAIVSSAPSGAQAAAINRLRQNFFEGF